MVSKSTFNKHMARAVLYSPLHMVGMNYPYFKIIQDQKGILNFMKQLRWNSTVTNNLLVVLSVIQSASGLCKPVLMDTHTNLTYISQGWFTHI